MEATAHLNLAISLPLRNEGELDSLISEVSDPKSPRYRNYLTPAEFAARFSPTQEDYDAVIQFAQAHGLTVTGTHSNRLLVDVTGSVPQVERAFHLRMMSYHNASRGEFFAPDREPQLDVDVAIQHISGLDNFVVPSPMALHAEANAMASAQVSTGSAPGGYFIGNDFRAAYAPGVTETGAGQIVGLVEFDGFYPTDVDKNFAVAGLPAIPIQTVLLDGFNGAPSYANIEVILDIMMAAYMAPGLSKVMVYEGFLPDDVLNRMATDNKAKQIGCSWTFGITSATEMIFKQFAAQGQSFFQAAGDSGAYKSGVAAPADNPYVTSVGGTHLVTAGAGGPWSSESVWGSSGGGISTRYTIPSYQQGFNLSSNGGSITMRNIPDVAIVADVQIYLICNNGRATVVGGTSVGAPLWAGFIALANERAASSGSAPVGFVNPALYAIGSSGNYSSDLNDVKMGSNGYAAGTGFDLATGWGSPVGDQLIQDLTQSADGQFTISASPNSLTLYQSGSANTCVTVNAANGSTGAVGFKVVGLPVGASVKVGTTSGQTTCLTFNATSTAVAGNYSLSIVGTTGTVSSSTSLSLSIPQQAFSLVPSVSSFNLLVAGPRASTAIAVASTNGFAGSVAFSIAGLPSGVTASWSAATSTTGTTLYLTPTSLAVPGYYTATVTGKSGTMSTSTNLIIYIPVPGFTLASSASSVKLLVGGSTVASTISVVNPAGLPGNVLLKLSGVPAGVTASLSASSTLSASTLSLRATTTALPGSYTVTVTGTSGIVTAQTSIALVIPSPGFSLTSSTSSMQLLLGGVSGSSTISVINPAGLASNVYLKLSGVPTGVYATLSTSSTLSTSTLTVRATSTAVPGTYTLTITGTSGIVAAQTSVALVIPTPGFSLSSSTPGMQLLVGGTSSTSNISVVNPVALAGIVYLKVSGAPAGVYASLSTGATLSASTLSVRAASTAAPGQYTLTVTGTSGIATAQAAIPITIPAPGFALSPSTTSLSVPLAGSGAAQVSVARINGFTGAVNLAVSGAPTGTTAVLSSTSTTSSSRLTITPGPATPTGNYSITVTGTSGTLTATANIQLTVL